MSSPSWLPIEPERTIWDAVIVGTGMGGATLGYALAAAGQRVLFVEKGPMLHDKDAQFERGTGVGMWPDRVRAETNLGDLGFRLPIGCVSGGSSAFYSAALERLAPADFEPRANFPDAHDSTLPERWPISYAALAPYYERAEALYRVRGTQDPLYRGGPSTLLEPPAQSPRDAHMEQSFAALGLHPYRVHVGCEFVPGCDGCPGGPCQRNCKRDAGSTCLVPALERYGAKLLPECEAVRLVAAADTVSELICVRAGTELRLRAKTFVLAAGAFMSPALLLRSANDVWPKGLANRSDLVGRNLMFHAGDFFAISPLRSLSGEGPQKTLAMNDFYQVDGAKLGTLQSLGVRLEVGQIMQYLRDTADQNPNWWGRLFASRPIWWRKVSSPIVRAFAMVFFHLLRFRDAAVWVSIIEDLPYAENRVWPDPDHPRDVCIRYRYSDELKGRVLLFRRKLKRALGRHRVLPLTQANKIDYPHVSGTCRFGTNPATSVLDANNRAHGIANLYVVDASFFPSSGGSNPSLTIAANALRVADVMLGRAAGPPVAT
jgi:choline dehydrogenase-like flavoprotein